MRGAVAGASIAPHNVMQIPAHSATMMKRGERGTRESCVQGFCYLLRVAIELPQPVVDLLQFIGVNWPTINEDSVRELATHVRQFAQNLESVHQDAGNTIQAMGQAYQGASYEALVSMWADKSSKHLQELTEACGVVADALDAGAEVIVGMKVAAIAELVALAASFVADQAAAVATFGLAEAALAAIELAARKCVDFLIQEIIGYLTGEIVGAALQPLLGKVTSALEGWAFSELSGAVGAGGAGGGAVGASFMVHAEDLMSHTAVLRGHAETASAHAQTFRSAVESVSFA